MNLHTLAPNQTVVTDKDKTCFFSYDTLIATIKDDKILLTDKYNYSKTTSKYLYKFLTQYTPYEGLNSKSLNKLILEGFITLDN